MQHESEQENIYRSKDDKLFITMALFDQNKQTADQLFIKTIKANNINKHAEFIKSLIF